MQLHFYTSTDQLDRMHQSGECDVWRKEHKQENDVHVSFDLEQYEVIGYGTSPIFYVRKKQ